MQAAIVGTVIVLAVGVSWPDSTTKKVETLRSQVTAAEETADEAHQKVMELEDKVEELESRVADVE